MIKIDNDKLQQYKAGNAEIAILVMDHFTTKLTALALEITRDEKASKDITNKAMKLIYRLIHHLDPLTYDALYITLTRMVTTDCAAWTKVHRKQGLEPLLYQ